MSPLLKLTPQEFEEFCYVLLECNGFKNLSWHGKGGGDKGRDIVCTKTEMPLAGVECVKRWLVQCKRYGAKTKVTKSLLHDWLAACREHHPDRVLLIVAGSLSSTLKDWLASASKDYPFEVHTWEELDIQREFCKHGDKLRKRFPQFQKVGRKIRLQHTNMSPCYVDCEGFDEVGFYILNNYGDKQNIRMVQEFIAFIKANDFKAP